MDTILLAQFERVEAALNTLVASIESYNPSTQAAIDLVAADDELSRGLDQLSHHQNNHARILALRTEDDALSAQLKSSISTLATLRHELQETPATTFSEDSRPVQFDELLRFARNISRHTVPPTYREPIPKDAEEVEKEKEKDKDKEEAGSNGVATPSVPAAGASFPSADEANKDPDGTGEGPDVKPVTEEQAEWLKKLHESGNQWTPWPSVEKIRVGNLHAIQALLDHGKDPNTELTLQVKHGSQVQGPTLAQAVEQVVEQPQIAAAPQEPQMQLDGVQQGGPVAAAQQAEEQGQFSGFDEYDSEDT
ncbi:vitamin-D-receptor interacting mediator subunit 4-domain-containing protein [Lophiotrema nucula]|uniref:Mediator of RNA polymerase II transcription subunit 4 n=1 Tax=Lophiotrema nucula TaxID=690887 RepID=A0A6A5YN41_9PLEO|nr:vitamin-D-receptor interacting mediator subunit 4-domain-containing protein [Lophiotrema nucula]